MVEVQGHSGDCINYLQALRESIVAANNGHDAENTLDLILDCVSRVFPYTAVNVMLLEQDLIHVVYFKGYKRPAIELNLYAKFDERPDIMRIATSGQPLVVTNSEQYDAGGIFRNRQWLATHIGLPIKWQDEIIGFLNIDCVKEVQIDAVQLNWLEAFAEQVGLALHNRRLVHEDIKRRKEIETLHEITAVVASTLNLDQLFERLLVYLQGLVAFDHSFLFLVDKGYLEIVAMQGRLDIDKLVGTRFDPSLYAIFQQLSDSQEIIVATNTTSDPRFNGFDVFDYCESWLGIPLWAHNSCIGYLTLDCDVPDAYGKPDIALVGSFANQVALAIYNAQLYEEVRRYAVELEDRVAARTAEIQRVGEEVKRSELRYRALFEATFEGICVHEQGTIVDANPAFARMFYYDVSEVMGKSVLELATEESKPIIREKILNQDVQLYEARGMRKDGTIFDMELIGKAFLYDNKQLRITALRDISQRKEAEAQKLELALEQERMQILSSFIKQASHEFRTPLSVIGTNSYLLRRRLSSDSQFDTQVILNHLQIIEQQVNHITALVDNMTILSRLDGLVSLPDLIEINLNEVVANAVNEMLHLAGSKRQNLISDRGDEDLFTCSNASYMHTAIKNIIKNAIRFTPESGSVVVRTAKENGCAIIEISDTGIGIDAEALPHIFERFYRSDKAGTTRGFGLGLSISSTIIEKSHGRIEVTSELHKGSTFRIILTAID